MSLLHFSKTSFKNLRKSTPIGAYFFSKIAKSLQKDVFNPSKLEYEVGPHDL